MTGLCAPAPVTRACEHPSAATPYPASARTSRRKNGTTVCTKRLRAGAAVSGSRCESVAAASTSDGARRAASRERCARTRRAPRSTRPFVRSVCERVERVVDAAQVARAQAQQSRSGRWARGTARRRRRCAASREVPLGRVGRARERVGQAADRRHLAVLPVARVAARARRPAFTRIRLSASGEVSLSKAKPSRPRFVAGTGGLNCAGSSGKAWPIGGRRRLPVARRRRRPGRRRRRPTAGRARAGRRTGCRCAASRARARVPARLGAVNEPSVPAVDQHEPVDVAVARAPAEVPRRVDRRQRGAERVAAEDDALALAPCAAHDAAQVARARPSRPQSRANPSVGVARRLEVRLDGRVGEPPEVVVERLLHRDATGARVVEHLRVLQRLRAAVDRPHLQAVHAPHEVAADEQEVAGAALEAGHEDQDRAAPATARSSSPRRVSKRAGPGPGEGTVTVRSAAAAGAAAAARRPGTSRTGRMRRVNLPWGHGGPDRIRPGQGHGRRAPAAGRLVQARAPRPPDHRRAQRRGQDDAAADARRRDVDRRRRARARQGHARRAARPAPAARARPLAARLRAVRLPRAARARGRAGAASSRRWRPATSGRSTATAASTRASRRPAATAGASARDRRRARPRLRRRRPRPPAAHVLRRPAHARVAGPRARRPARPAAARRAHQPPRHRVARVARADAARARRGDRAWSPTTAGSWRRSAPPCSSSRPAARASSRAPGRSGAASRRRARWRSAGRSRSSRPRSSAWSASSSASATRRPRRARRSRASRRWTRWSASSATRATAARWASSSRRPSARAASIFELEDGRLEVPGRVLLLDGGELWLERGEHVSLVGPNGTGKTTLIEALAGRRELDGGRLRSGHNVQGRLPQPARRRARVRRRRGTVLEARGQAHRA